MKNYEWHSKHGPLSLTKRLRRKRTLRHPLRKRYTPAAEELTNKTRSQVLFNYPGIVRLVRAGMSRRFTEPLITMSRYVPYGQHLSAGRIKPPLYWKWLIKVHN